MGVRVIDPKTAHGEEKELVDMVLSDGHPGPFAG